MRWEQTELEAVSGENSMAFVNEYIAEEDVIKYGLEEIDSRFVVGGVKARDWTIDRERGVYLRVVARGREEISHQSTWTFYWKGQLLDVELENVSTIGPVDGHRHGHKRVRSLEIPHHLRGDRDAILSDLEEALIAYKTGGVFSSAASYSLTLDL
jgi:hypothetical protein